jgi:hypothetical protein
MGIWADRHRVVLTLHGTPERVLDVVRRSTDASFFRVLGRKGVRWPEAWGARPWRAARRGGAALLAASDARLAAAEEELTAALRAYRQAEAEEYGAADGSGDTYTPDRDMECEELSWIILLCPENTHAAGRTLAALLQRDYPLLQTWSICSREGRKGWCLELGHDTRKQEVGFNIQAYTLGGDTVTFSFWRYGLSWGYEDDLWPIYERLAAALPRDMRHRIIAEKHEDPYTAHCLADGQKTCWHMPWLHNGEQADAEDELEDEFWECGGCSRLAQESDDSAVEHAGGGNGGDDDDDGGDDETDGVEKYFSFFDFCAQGVDYDAEACRVAREWSPDGFAAALELRGRWLRAARIIQRMYRRAAADPAFALCRRRLGRLFSAYGAPEYSPASVAFDDGGGVWRADGGLGPLFKGVLMRTDVPPQTGACGSPRLPRSRQRGTTTCMPSQHVARLRASNCSRSHLTPPGASSQLRCCRRRPAWRTRCWRRRRSCAPARAWRSMTTTTTALARASSASCASRHQPPPGVWRRHYAALCRRLRMADACVAVMLAPAARRVTRCRLRLACG